MLIKATPLISSFISQLPNMSRLGHSIHQGSSAIKSSIARCRVYNGGISSSIALPSLSSLAQTSPLLSYQTQIAPVSPQRRLFSYAATKMAGNAMTAGKFNHDLTVAPKADRVLPLFSLKGRTAIVSGAGAGIGLAVAQGFAEAGANVAIWYNSNKSALDRAKEIEETYGVQCRSFHSTSTSSRDGPLR